MQELESREEGLSDSEAKERLTYYGTNELRKRKKKSIGKMLLEQITDVMVLILIAAAVLSMILGEWRRQLLFSLL